MRKRLYSLTADLHLYIGLFLSPFVLLFAASVVILNHPGIPTGAPAQFPERFVQLHPPSGVEKLEGMERVQQARRILSEAGVSGEVGVIRFAAEEAKLTIPVSRPGTEFVVGLTLSNGSASIQERKTGFWDSLIFLHKMPGPHLANIRGNWPMLRVWAWLSDGTASMLIFLSVSGICLWIVLRTERRVGVLLILAGALSLMGILYAVCS